MKRTLVISNACFSDRESNGRTLKNLFAKAEPEKLAQFFVYGTPDFGICQKYYQVSDREALGSLNLLKAYGGSVEPAGDLAAGSPLREDGQAGAEVAAYTGNTRKTPIKMLARELVWLLGHWRNRRFWRWVEDFRPEMLCLFLANNTFLVRLAVQIGKKYGIPVVVYSTEGYCFMDYNYFTNRPSLAYTLYYAWLRASYRKVVPYVAEGFFNCTLLRDRYEEEFGYPCRCVMNGSGIDYVDRCGVERERTPVISYLGNLGLGRHKALMEIAQALQEIDSGLQLDIYGAASSDTVKKELEHCPGVKFWGFVSYEEVVRVIHESSLLVHAEWNDRIVNRDLKYAFSTKIGDSICSGTPFLIYADEGLAETIFLKENDCAFVVEKKGMLKQILQRALTDEKERKRIGENAKIAKEKFYTGNDEFIKAFL